MPCTTFGPIAAAADATPYSAHSSRKYRYFLLEWALYGVASAAAAIGPNVVQGIAGVLIGMLCLLITPRLERVAKL